MSEARDATARFRNVNIEAIFNQSTVYVQHDTAPYGSDPAATKILGHRHTAELEGQWSDRQSDDR